MEPKRAEQKRIAVSTVTRFVRIYAGESKGGLFWLTPDAAQSRAFRHLGRERQLICLRAPPINADRPPPSLQELALYFADSVVESGVNGPIVLVGYCIAAVLAREVALELHSRNLEIGALIMIDPPDPAESLADVISNPLSYRLIVGWRRITMHLGRVLRLGPRLGLDYLHGSLHGIWKRLVYQRSRRAYERAASSGQPTEAAFNDGYLVSVAAFMNSRPRVYPGRASVIRPVDAPKGVYRYANRRWSQLISGGIDVIDVPGSSETMWQEPAVVEMARAVKRCSSAG